MATNFPASLDDTNTLPNPGASDLVATVDHATLHDNTGAAIKALEAKVGVNASTPAQNELLIGGAVAGTTDWTTLTSAVLRAMLTDETGTGAAVFGTSPTIATPEITRPKITTSIDDSSGNEVIKTPATASAVNELTVTNAATGTAPILSASGSDTNIDLKTAGKGTGKAYPDSVTEWAFDFIVSGMVWSGDAYASTRAASMTAGFAYISGVRVTIAAVTARTFTASKDTYIDLGSDGVLDYNEVANNAASPALSANHIRVGIIVTGAGNIAAVGSVNQGQEDKVLPIASSVPYQTTDSLGNLIYPRDSQRKLLGYRQILTDFSTTSGTSVQVTGLSVPVIIPSGRKVKVSAFTEGLQNSGSAGNIMQIWEGVVLSGTALTRVFNDMTAAADRSEAYMERTYTPTSTSLTYNIGLLSGANTATINAGVTYPAFIKVELA